ncbi:hypothetical protein [uncultured Aliiroseovarius sp.]
MTERQFLNVLSFCMLLPGSQRCSFAPMPVGDCAAFPVV